MVKLASVQANVVYGDPDANAANAVGQIRHLASDGVQIVLFPECFLTGYCVETRTQAERIAIPRTHIALDQLQTVAAELSICLVVGFAERENDTLFNSAALFDGDAAPQFYRKSHLPDLGYDKFAEPGHELPVFDTRFGRIGILICFDQRFPEPVRVQALAGADLILLPTNWPEGANVSADSICIARAAENRIWFVTCNRVGEENGFRFIGRSKIISPTGEVIEGAEAEAKILTAELDLSLARQKRTITIPGKYETDVFEPRQPALYESLSRPR